MLSKLSMVIATHSYCRFGKQARRLVRETESGHFKVFGRDLHPDAVAAPFRRRNVGRAGSHEGIEHRVSDEAEHADKPLRQLQGIRRWMVSSRSSGDTRPYLLEPFLVILGGDYAEHARGERRRAIAAGLPLHQDEFDIVLDHCV